MPINPNFSFYTDKQEQSLMEDLINEALSIFGFESFYIPKAESINPDLLYGDDPLKAFIDAYPIHVYMTNSLDNGMNRDFFSKFGLETKNSVRVLLSKRIFDRMVKNNPFERPAEGDLIYIPWLSGTGELYEITYTNDSADFFILGRKYPYYWELELELFKYSHETIEVGIAEINEIEDDHGYGILYEMKEPFTGSAANYIKGETVVQERFPFYIQVNDTLKEVQVEVLDNYIIFVDKNNILTKLPASTETLPLFTKNGMRATVEIIKEAQATVVEWDAALQRLKLNVIQGVFLENCYVNGLESGANYKIAVYNPIDLPLEKDSHDNYNLQVMAEPLINTKETNSFGLL